MARIGLAHLVAADYDQGSYKNGIRIPGAVSIEINPVYEDDSEYSQLNDLEEDKKISSADVTLELSESEDVLTSQTKGIGFRSMLRHGGNRMYCAVWLHKVRLYETGESYSSKNDSLTYTTAKLEGKAAKDDTGNWRTKELFKTKKEADAWLDNKAGIE